MSDDHGSAADGAPASIGTRGFELAVACALMLLAALVLFDSVRVGIGWADDGPRSGYFPFYIGLLLLASSGTVLVSTLLRWRKTDEAFADREQLLRVGAVFAPMVVYVAGIAWLGIYAASLLLIGYFMRRHGKYGWPLTAAVSIGAPLAFYLVFERWFVVPLPKGPIEQYFGL